MSTRRGQGVKVVMNRQEILVGDKATLRELLLSKSVPTEGTSVAINNRIVGREFWNDTYLSNNDVITVILPLYAGKLL